MIMNILTHSENCSVLRRDVEKTAIVEKCRKIFPQYNMKTSSAAYLKKQFQSHVKNRQNHHPIISATHVATIVGLNRYENNRDLFLKQLPNRQRQGQKHAEENKTNNFSGIEDTLSPCEIGIKYEPKAIECFRQRHDISDKSGFVPPYLFTETHCKSPLSQINSEVLVRLGAAGDYVFIDKNKTPVLLEIKCLVTRKITRKVPIHYYLQIQTMLYLYHLLQLPIKSAIYCENRFSSEKLEEYWENRIELDLDYYEKKILPILANYFEILQKHTMLTKRPRKRSRDDNDSDSDRAEKNSIFTKQPITFFTKRRRLCNSLISRVDFRNIYTHFLAQPTVFGPNCLDNYLNNNLLRDWYYYQKLTSETNNNYQTPLTQSKRLSNTYSYNSVELLEQLRPVLNQLRSKDDITENDNTENDITENDNTENLEICNIEDELRPSHPEICTQTHIQHFIPLKFARTVQALKTKADIIIGGQLYNPQKNIWVNYDILVKNRRLKDLTVITKIDSETTSDATTKTNMQRPYPNHYTPVKMIQYRYNKENLTSRQARLELVMQLETLNFYFSNENLFGLVLDSEKQVTEIDFRKHPKIALKLQNGLEWLETLTDNSLEADPPNDNRLFPNCKVTTRDSEFEKFKNELIDKNGELTTLWSISCLKRDKLVNCNLGIRTIQDLEANIKKKTVKEILGPIYPNIYNMLLANRKNKIIGLANVREELRALKSDCEIFLDFEFTPNFIYVIGYYQAEKCKGFRKLLQKSRWLFQKRNSGSVNPKTFRQLVLKDNTDNSHQQLLEQFLENIKQLARNNNNMINCYHWGQVEERLIKKHVPELFTYLNFIDLHEILVDFNLAIPNCRSYTLKEIAKSLKIMGLISTEWQENTDGYWCNKALSRILNNTKNSDSMSSETNTSSKMTELKNCEGFDKILKYNQTDCQVLHDLVVFFRSC